MKKSNLISGVISPEKTAEVLKCLEEAETSLNFLVSLSNIDKKRLTKMGDRSVGYVDECIRAFSLYPNLLPGNLDLDELKSDRALYESVRLIAGKLRGLHEKLQDSVAALGSDMMSACNDGYAALKRTSLRDSSIKQTTDIISRRYVKNGLRMTMTATEKS